MISDEHYCAGCGKFFKNFGNALMTQHGNMHKRCFDAFEKGMAKAPGVYEPPCGELTGRERERLDALLTQLKQADSILMDACRLLGQDERALAVRVRACDWQVACRAELKP